ncbi:MAG: general secretion pathway protein GspK [Betaproteobacteria bacterium]|nr:general secretion pathway protein GspK [Betaproteobacteria bacterium]
MLALWLTILLTAIASGFAYSMRSEALAARNAVSLAQARAAADGAVQRTAYELTRPRMVGAWTLDGQPRAWQDGDASIVASAVDEGSRIDINTAPDSLIKSLLMNVGGMDDAAATALVDAIGDWRDPDDLRRPNGAEAPEYAAANLKYGPANAPFETVGEVSRVLGMTPRVFQRIRGAITVYSRQPGINAATAGRSVLLALPNATPDAVDAFIAERAQAIAQGLPVPPFAPAQAFVGAATPVWRIRAVATMPDGVTFGREAVLQPSPDVRRPLITLAWLDAPRASPAKSIAPAANDANP